VLLAAEGLPAAAIAERVGVSRPAVVAWRKRYQAGGLAALGDAPRSGAPASIDQDKRDEILVATLTLPPAELGITHWSSRLLARQAIRRGSFRSVRELTDAIRAAGRRVVLDGDIPAPQADAAGSGRRAGRAGSFREPVDSIAAGEVGVRSLVTRTHCRSTASPRP
jgi:transposase-like protein